MKNIELSHIYVVLTTSMVVSCPENFALPVVNCLDILELAPGESAIMSDSKTVAQFCRNGTFFNAVECVSKLLDTCPDAIKFADPKSWQSGFDTLCNNINLHSEHMPCIALQHTKVTTCLKKPQEQSPSGSASKLSIICSYFHRYRNCISQPITDHCGKNIGNVFREVVSGITPHKCSEMINNSYQHVFNTNTLILIFIISNIGRFLSIQPG